MCAKRRQCPLNSLVGSSTQMAHGGEKVPVRWWPLSVPSLLTQLVPLFHMTVDSDLLPLLPPEAQRGEVTCLGSHGLGGSRQSSKPHSLAIDALLALPHIASCVTQRKENSCWEAPHKCSPHRSTPLSIRHREMTLRFLLVSNCRSRPSPRYPKRCLHLPSCARFTAG